MVCQTVSKIFIVLVQHLTVKCSPGTIYNWRNGGRRLEQVHLVNTGCNESLKLACMASQAHLIQGQLLEGCTLVNTLLVPEFLLCSIIFVFAIKEDVSNFT